MLIYNDENKTYSFTKNNEKSIFEKKNNKLSFKKKLDESYDLFEMEFIDENDTKQINFNIMKKKREVLCDKMVEFVLNKKDKKVSNQVIKEYISCPEVLNNPNYEYLGQDLCNFFSSFVVSFSKKNEDNNIFNYFKLESIYLNEESEKDLPRGGGLMYAVFQGIKMGILLLTANNDNEQYNFSVSSPDFRTTHNYMVNTEKLQYTSGTIYISKCQDNIHFCWIYRDKNNNKTIKEENNNILRSNGKYPLIISRKEPIFTPGSATAKAIKDHVVFLIHKHIKGNQFNFLSDVLVQTVFDKFNIIEKEAKFNIDFQYKQMFMRINILDDVINELKEKYNISISKEEKKEGGKLKKGQKKKTSKKPVVSQNKENKYKEVLGKRMKIYKKTDSRKEFVRYKGELVPLVEYKKSMK